MWCFLFFLHVSVSPLKLPKCMRIGKVSEIFASPHPLFYASVALKICSVVADLFKINHNICIDLYKAVY
jgi:hypothetical protein